MSKLGETPVIGRTCEEVIMPKISVVTEDMIDLSYTLHQKAEFIMGQLGVPSDIGSVHQSPENHISALDILRSSLRELNDKLSSIADIM